VFQLVKVVLVSIRTKFELSMCLVCPTIEINVCSAYLQNVLVRFFLLPLKHCGSEKTALLCKGSLGNYKTDLERKLCSADDISFFFKWVQKN